MQHCPPKTGQVKREVAKDVLQDVLRKNRTKDKMTGSRGGSTLQEMQHEGQDQTSRGTLPSLIQTGEGFLLKFELGLDLFWFDFACERSNHGEGHFCVPPAGKNVVANASNAKNKKNKTDTTLETTRQKRKKLKYTKMLIGWDMTSRTNGDSNGDSPG